MHGDVVFLAELRVDAARLQMAECAISLDAARRAGEARLGISLQGFVDALKSRGFLISNFYNTTAPSFRVGCIGAITPDDMRRFTAAVDTVLTQLGVRHRGASQKVA